MNNKSNLVKILGMFATVVGMGATLLSNWASEQKMNQIIEEKVDAALAERDNDDDEDDDEEEEA